jgi:hypothetical protein
LRVKTIYKVNLLLKKVKRFVQIRVVPR